MKEFSKEDAGVHQARLVKVIDSGTHTSNFNGEDKDNRQVSIAFQIPFRKDGKDYCQYATADFKGLWTPYKSENAKIKSMLDALGYDGDSNVIDFLCSKIGTVILAKVEVNEYNGKIRPIIARKGFTALPAGMPDVDWGAYIDKYAKLGDDKVSVMECFAKAGTELGNPRQVTFESIDGDSMAYDYKWLKQSNEWKDWLSGGGDTTPVDSEDSALPF